VRTDKRRSGKRRPSHCRTAISKLVMRRAGRVVSRARRPDTWSARKGDRAPPGRSRRDGTDCPAATCA
jgi:hypothetical protein